MTDTALPGGVFVGPGQHGSGLRWRLARRRAHHRRETAFVFAGGGSRGAAQVGMLKALARRGIVPDAIYGASVGAINAAGFAGDATAEGVERLATTWRSITREHVFPQGRFPSPWRFFQQRESVFSNEGIRKIIHDGVAFERIEDSPIHLEVVATSLTDGRIQWFAEGPAEQAILASAALPALLPPVTIDGEAFIDGGVVDNVPMWRAIQQGAKTVFVLMCGPLHYTPHKYRRPAEAVLTAFFIAVHASFTRQLAALPRDVEVVVFTVDTDPVSGYDDFSGTDALIDAGLRNAELVLTHWESGRSGDRSRRRSAQAPPALPAPPDDMLVGVADRPPTTT